MTNAKERIVRARGIIKDFGSLIVSSIALAVSILALYWNVHVIDDLRFTIGNDNNIPNPDSDAKQIILYGPHLLTFINSGNRAVAVLRIQLAIFQSTISGDRANDCPEQESEMVGTAIEPFAVRPGEILVKPISIDKKLQRNDRGDPVVRLNEKMYRTVLCVVFDLATPDNIPSTITVPLTSSEYTTSPFGSTDMLYTPSKPIRLFPR
jgi:hypothetical protein